jgi:transposase
VEVIHARCAGLDVHKDTVVASIRVAEAGCVHRETKTFKTMTGELCALLDWLEARKCTHVAMEATGVYWKPVWHVLVETFELVLANAADVKNVPGRKTDVNDAEWLADLLAHGLIRSNYVPEESVQVVRELTRTRKQLVREATRHVQRVEKVLQDANIKLSSVLSDVMGKSARAMLQAIIDGETDPNRLVGHIHTRIGASHDEVKAALRGTVTKHHRFELKLHLKLYDQLREAVKEVEERISEALEPFQAVVERLTSIPGVSDTVAAVIAGEVGVAVEKFPSPGHLVSWAGLCPRMDESAGKRRSTRIRHGNSWLKTALVQAAWSAVRTKGGHLRALFHRLKARRGVKKAIVAVAHSILSSVWHMLKYGSGWQDLGEAYLEKKDKARLARRYTTRLEALGFTVALSAANP